MKISLLTGGDDANYAFPLLSSLISNGITVDFIGSDAMKDADIVKNENVIFHNFRGSISPHVPIKNKILRILKYYYKLLTYTAHTNSKIFHILWLNKFIYFDRTLLNIYYKLQGKTLIFTAHNINAAERDGKDTVLNRLTLKFMYKIVDHIIVHTKKMKVQLIENFNIREKKVTVIPFGINTFLHKSELTTIQARKILNLSGDEKNLLFFGRIEPYKGLEYLILALVNLKEKYKNFKLIIAGSVGKNCFAYWENVKRTIKVYDLKDYIIQKIEFIPDEDIEVYFKAADVLVLPYKYIFQSGPLFISYNFGLPVIASDVGSFKEDIVEGKTGYICRPEDPRDLAEKIDLYFKSDLYKNLEENRNKIIKCANEKYSWEKNGKKIYSIYKKLI